MSTDGTRWAEVDRLLETELLGDDPILEEALRASEAAGLPPISVSATQGRLLELVARIAGARRILEIGTLGGYSTIWLARALPVGGRLVTLELSERHAAVARSNLERAGFADVAEVRVGPALDALAGLLGEGAGPFDLVFVDADKGAYPEYFAASLRLSRPGTVIIADNVVRDGEVANATSTDANVKGVQQMLALAGRTAEVSATAIQTVGEKGYDGFAIALVTAAGL